MQNLIKYTAFYISKLEKEEIQKVLHQLTVMNKFDFIRFISVMTEIYLNEAKKKISTFAAKEMMTSAERDLKEALDSLEPYSGRLEGEQTEIEIEIENEV